MAKVQRRLADSPQEHSPAQLAALIREEAVVISDLDVLDIMRTLRDETVVLALRDANSSALVREAANERSRHVVMPLRL